MLGQLLNMEQGAATVTAQILPRPVYYSEPRQGGSWKLVGKGEHTSVCMCRGLSHGLPYLICEAD